MVLLYVHGSPAGAASAHARRDADAQNRAIREAAAAKMLFEVLTTQTASDSHWPPLPPPSLLAWLMRSACSANASYSFALSSKMYLSSWFATPTACRRISAALARFVEPGLGREAVTKSEIQKCTTETGRRNAPKNGHLLQFSGSRQKAGSVLTTAIFALFLAKLKHSPRTGT